MGDESPKRARMFRTCCQDLIRHVTHVCDEEKALGRNHLIVFRSRDRAANYLDITRQSICNVMRGKCVDLDPGDAEERERGMQMSDEEALCIRPALVAMLLARKHVTLDSLLDRIKTDNPGWIWGRTTLFRALHNRCGIEFVKRTHDYYARLREDPEKCQRRAWCLKFLFMYEEHGREFVFMDETWLDHNMVPTRCWTDGKSDCEPDVPPGKGPRWIIIGAGSIGGWIPNTFVMWKGNVLSEDYHTEMNGDVFSDWFLTRLLPNVPGNACVVLDRAPYHTLLTEHSKGAKSTMNKEALATWLVDHEAKDDNGSLLTKETLLGGECAQPDRDGKVRKCKGWTRQMMWALAQQSRPKPQYLFHEWAKEYNGTNITVLLLPVAKGSFCPSEYTLGRRRANITKGE